MSEVEKPINSLKRVLHLNHLDADKFPCWLSDGLHSIPPDSAFDLIISSPPNFIIEDFMKELSPGRLGGFDPQWEFHRQFYAQCDKYLSARGETWFNENSDGAQPETFLPFIQSNPALEYVGRFDEPLIPGFFWMKTKKVSK